MDLNSYNSPMCGRFSVISNSKTVEKHFNLVRFGEFIHSYNVNPSNNRQYDECET
jgi:putative SOS response-associated peptidase YedK